MSAPVRVTPNLRAYRDLLGLTLFGFHGRNRAVGLDDHGSRVAAVRTPIHRPRVSAHPENNILRMAFWAEPLRSIVHAHILPVRPIWILEISLWVGRLGSVPQTSDSRFPGVF